MEDGGRRGDESQLAPSLSHLTSSVSSTSNQVPSSACHSHLSLYAGEDMTDPSVSSTGGDFWKLDRVRACVRVLTSLVQIFSSAPGQETVTTSNAMAVTHEGRETASLPQEHPGERIAEEEEEEEGGGGEKDKEEGFPILYFTCYTLQGQKKVIAICEDQTFQNFMDFIENEFGSTYWPSLVEQLSGFHKYILHDDDFLWLCEHAEVNGGRADIQLEVTPVMWPEEVVKYSKVFSKERFVEKTRASRLLKR
eukprot:747936-Hanusia_phi.AAC.2